MYTVLFLIAIVSVATADEGEGEDFQCKGKDTIEKVSFDKSCGQNITVTTAVSVIAAEHVYKVIPQCLYCSLSFDAEPGYQLSATFHTFGTETGPKGNCTKNRVDVYNGQLPDESQRVSNASGICGCDLPNEVYKSKGNYMTLVFITECTNKTVQHGEFEIVISAFKKDKLANISTCPGQFECNNDSVCIDKNLICNGKPDCKDKSDESNCKAKPEPKLTPLWLFILIGLAAVCLILLFIIVILLCFRYCCTDKMAKAYERFK